MKHSGSKLIFLAFTLLFGIFFIYRLVSPIVLHRNISMTIIKQKGIIRTLDTPVLTDFTAKYYINTINFRPGYILYHNDLGDFAYDQNFFLFFNSVIHVNKEGLYTFMIASDDGFRLKLNGRLIGEFISDRSYNSNLYTIFLARGKYIMDLSYFQGFGPQGLSAQYRFNESTIYYFFGEDSSFMSFSR